MLLNSFTLKHTE